MLTDLLRRLRALVRPSSLERELDDELQFHLQRAIERHQRNGLSLADATRRARLDIGGLEQVKEACRDERGISSIDRLRQDLRFAIRVLRKSPGFTATVAGTLALGVGATTTAFGVVDGMVLKPLPYRDADQLVQLGTRFGNISVAAMSLPDIGDVASRTKTLAIGAGRSRTFDVTGSAAPEQIAGAAVSAAFFDVLGVSPAIGRGLAAGSDARATPPTALVAYEFWQRRLGADRDAVGRYLTLNGVAHLIVGVLPRGFRGPEAVSLDDAQVWVPLGTVRGATDDRDDASWSVIGRLAAGAVTSHAAAELDVIGEAIGQQSPGAGRRTFWLAALRERTIGEGGVGPLWLLFGAVSLVLVIACANIASLFLVRSAGRAREMAIRVAMGATRGRLVRQLLAESALVCCAGGTIGIAIAATALGIFRGMAPADLPRLGDVALDLRVVMFSSALTALAAVVFGLAPAVEAARTTAGDALRCAAASLAGHRYQTRFRSTLVVVQMSLALVLLVGAALLVNSLVRLGAVHPGFQTDDVVWMDVTLPQRYVDPKARLQFFEAVLPAVRGVTGVRGAGLIGGRPVGGGNAVATMHPTHQPVPDANETARYPFHVVTPGYFAAMGIPIIDGRDVSDDDRSSAARVAVVSRALANRFWPGERAVGQRFWMGRIAADAPAIDVVGVVEDVLQYGLARSAEPIVFRPLAQTAFPRATLSLIVRHDGRDEAAVLAQLREAIWRLDPALPLDRTGTMAAALSASIGEPRFRALALAIFSAIAAVVAGVGLYATLAWIVRARRRELGIRMVLGADAGAVRSLVVRRGLYLTAAGLVLGTIVAAAASRLLSSMVFGVTTTDAPTFAVAAGVLGLVGAVASWSPARRAAALDPIETLRVE